MPGIVNFNGVVPPVCTPLTEDFQIDVPSLERLIRFQLDGGVHGLFMLGSTSETAAITEAQREQVLEVAVRTAGGQVPVLAGVIDMGTAQVLEHIRIAEGLGVDGFVATPPFYIRPSQDEIISHFRMLCEATSLPIFAYEIPSNVQTSMARATIASMAREGLIAGLKDSSGNEGNFRGVMLDTNGIDGFSIFTGSELTVDSALLMGADGVVPGLGNVDPAGYVRIYDAVRDGDTGLARVEQERLIRLFDIIWQATPGRTGFTASALGGFKTALMLRGVIDTNVMGRPMTRLNDEETGRIREILVETGLL
jgi:4-hydroxy-tetrahydrodipicolinate synthase